MNLLAPSMPRPPKGRSRPRRAPTLASLRTVSMERKWRSRMGSSGPSPRARPQSRRAGEVRKASMSRAAGARSRVASRSAISRSAGSSSRTAMAGGRKRAASMMSAQRTSSARSGARPPKCSSSVRAMKPVQEGAVGPRTSGRRGRARRWRGHVSRAGTRWRGGRTTSEASGDGEKRKSTQAFTSPSKAPGGERIALLMLDGTWCMSHRRARALREEAAEERGRGAAVETVAVVEDLEPHGSGPNLACRDDGGHPSG